MATYKIIINHAGFHEDVMTLDANLSEQTIADIFSHFVKDVLEAATGYNLDDPIVSEGDIQRVAANGRLYCDEMDTFLIDIYKTN